MTSPVMGERPAKDVMWGLLGLGLTLQVAGFLTAALQLPDTDLTMRGPVETGSETAVVLGLLAFGLGGVLSLVAVVAFGVMLGMRAHRQDGRPVHNV